MTPISCPSRSTWTRAQICTHWGGGSPPLRIVQSDVRNTVYPTLLKLGFLMNQPGETGEAKSPRQRLPTLPLSLSSEPVLHMGGGAKQTPNTQRGPQVRSRKPPALGAIKPDGGPGRGQWPKLLVSAGSLSVLSQGDLAPCMPAPHTTAVMEFGEWGAPDVITWRRSPAWSPEWQS